jgi:hypothetical protein
VQVHECTIYYFICPLRDQSQPQKSAILTTHKSDTKTTLHVLPDRQSRDIPDGDGDLRRRLLLDFCAHLAPPGVAANPGAPWELVVAYLADANEEQVRASRLTSTDFIDERGSEPLQCLLKHTEKMQIKVIL